MFKLVEKFKSIQSEGFHAGTPANFLRFYGCNLACDFGNGFKCDESLHSDKSKVEEYCLETIIEFCQGIRHVVITGGEPSLNNLNDLILALKENGHYVQVETNGYSVANIIEADWITYSPKLTWNEKASELDLCFDEVKLLGSPKFIPDTNNWSHDVLHKYLQPIGHEDGWDMDNVKWAADWVIKNPDWKLSLQTHKIYGGQ